MKEQLEDQEKKVDADERTKNAIDAILNELFRAERLHPLWPDDPVHAVAVLAEEAGEAIRAANDMKWKGEDTVKLRRELIQTGAMAVRCLINLEG